MSSLLALEVCLAVSMRKFQVFLGIRGKTCHFIHHNHIPPAMTIPDNPCQTSGDLWGSTNHSLQTTDLVMLGFTDGSAGIEFAFDAGHQGSTPRSGRIPGAGNGIPFQYSCLENPMNKRTQQAKVQRDCKELDTTEHDDGFEVKVWLWHEVSFDPESTAYLLCDPMVFIENPWTLISLSLKGR